MQFFLSRWTLLGTVTAIFAIGLVMIFSTTSAEVIDQSLEKGYYQALLKQFFYACFGLLFGYGLYRLGPAPFFRLSPVILLVLVATLVLVLIPGIGKEVNGSKRWLQLFGLSFQPSEFVKFTLPAAFIYSLGRSVRPLTLIAFIKLCAPFAVPIALIMIEPNNGTAGVIALTLLLLCLLMGIPWRFWALPLAVALAIGGVFAAQLPYVKKRIYVYLHPEADLQGKGHQPYQAKIATGSGKVWGKGPGQSWQKLSYLPEAQNDYIAAIYAEEFGFMGILLLIIAYMLLTCVGFARALSATTFEGACLAAALTFLISFQAFLNLGVVSGLLPSTGLNLPFFSQGGCSLIANMCCIGVMVGIPCQADACGKSFVNNR